MRQEMGWIATTFGIASALGYMSANVCLRSLTNLDPIWVSCVKAVPTVVAFAPLLIVQAAKGRSLFPSFRMLILTVLAGLCGQLAGNVCFQWSLGVVGIALTVPITLGSMILTGALLGRWVLGDRVTLEMVYASIVLILAICILSLGAGRANASIRAAEQTPWIQVAGAVAAACLSGLAFSVLGVVLRYASNRNTPLPSLLFTMGLVGVLVLGAMAISRESPRTLWQNSQPQLAALVAAGLFNVLAFWALTKALQISPVLFVNALNASQTAMAAIAGVLLFREPLSLPMISGVLLTAIGLLMMRSRRGDTSKAETTPLAEGEQSVAPTADSVRQSPAVLPREKPTGEDV